MSPINWWAAGIALAGVSTHLLLFIRGEWEKHTPTVAAFYCLIAGALLLFLAVVKQLSAWDLAITFSVAAASYTGALFASIGIYRYFFHQLRSFPGPKAARLTGFWSVAVSVPGYQFHKQVQQLHREFGDFVRIRLYFPTSLSAYSFFCATVNG